LANIHDNALGGNHNNSGGAYDQYQRHDQDQGHYQSIKIIQPQHDQSKVAAHRKQKKGGKGDRGGKGKHLKAESPDVMEESRSASYNNSPSQPPISEMDTGDSGGYYK